MTNLKVLVDHSGYDLYNVGDAAMLIAAVRALQADPRVGQIMVIANNAERVSGLVADVVPVVPSRRWGDRAPAKLRAVARYAGKITAPTLPSSIGRMTRSDLVAAIHGADVVISSGGGFINDTFRLHALSVLSVLHAAQRQSKPTAMFGQGLGPLTSGVVQTVAGRVLPKLDVLGLREGAIGPDLAVRLGVDRARVRVTGDMANGIACAPAALLGTALGLNLRMASYTNIGNNHLEVLTKGLNNLVDLTMTNYVALPVSFFHKDGNDSDALRSLGEGSSNPTWLKANGNDSSPPTERLAANIALCRAVFVSSYHAAVFALAQGIPVVGIGSTTYYDYKFQGLADLYGRHAVGYVALSDPCALQQIELSVREKWALGDQERTQIARRADELRLAHLDAIREFIDYVVPSTV